jgi:uncharacterized protein YneF (UPF0154 family)
MSLIAKLEILLLVLLAYVAVFFVGYFHGKSVEREDTQVRQAKADKQAVKAAVVTAQKDATVSTGQEQSRETIRTVYRTITKEVEKNVAANPDYLRCGLDADGLRLWNDANAGNPLDGPGQRDAGLPGLAAGGRWKLGVTIPQPQGSGAKLPGLPGAEPGQGGDHPQP